MIYEVNGKNIVFGMQWKSMLSQVHVHKEARAAKSPYLWHAEKAFYYGLLGEPDQKAKLKTPMFSGAIAFLHRFPDTPNMLLVLDVAHGGYIVCGVHQGRPRDRTDIIVEDETAVSRIIQEFSDLCGAESFVLYGDVEIEGIRPTTLEEIAEAADAGAQLRKVQSALVSPLYIMVGVVAAVAIGSYLYTAYSHYRLVEAQKKAAAAQKNSQQIYTDELTARRADVALAAPAASALLTSLRGLSISVGGWDLAAATCSPSQLKQIVCEFEYKRGLQRQATFKTFVDASAKTFDNVDFGDEKIKAIRSFKDVAFESVGKAIDSGRKERDEVIEFGSTLQALSNLGKHSRQAFAPFALPAGANLAELTQPPVSAAAWEFNTPLRSLDALDRFPAYATVSKIEITIDKSPKYDVNQSMAMAKVSGMVYSKPN
jgi:hypothetical protein